MSKILQKQLSKFSASGKFYLLSSLCLKQLAQDCRFSHDPNKFIFDFPSYVLTENKENDYADFLTQFELLYRDTVMFDMRSKIRNFLKAKLINIGFSTLKSYSFIICLKLSL